MESPSNPSSFDFKIADNEDGVSDIIEVEPSHTYYLKQYLVPILVGVVLVVVICLALVWFATDDSDKKDEDKWDNTFLIVSLDGWPDKFLDDKDPSIFPTLSKMMAEGVSAEYMKPVFPTKTFPNHYSIITGLYPTNHGICHNTMYDPTTDEVFTMRTEDPYWWDGEPLWITAQKQNQKSGTMFWPGSDVKIDGMYPTYYQPFNDDIPFNDRVDQIITWLKLPYDERPTVLTLYFEEPDTTEHRYGPDNSTEVDPVLTRVDNTLAYLFEQMEEAGVYDKVDVVVVSDHGMTETPPDKIRFVEDYDMKFGSIFQINNPNYNTTGMDGWCVACGNVATFIPFEGNEDEILNKMSMIDGIQTYTNVTIEEERPDWDYYGNVRIPAIIAVGDLGYNLNTEDCGYTSLGGHGYDNEERDMQAIFIARGPHFKDGGVVTPPIDNLNIYNMAASLLNLKPAPNNGTLTMEEIDALYFK
eukprot:CAMPEP_0201527092 /NCGR_PEP_ID=MMETSP0161_2-20130828/33959_1 /ASSEMBLY_ACC=CAM_ASM_000251 /TAXON_ID=180227 /ORGANISM="Neoparamoeba aestuarina, Strain SoJaBio B1-5/56/2" /LENGTH=470 /DNA_ID=CAMNT_0047927755 /DNA_START=93 /DNA_END=1505 /DNA_ORIENTATION=-